MKKILAVLLAALIALGAVPVFAAERETCDYIEHEAIVMVAPGYTAAAGLGDIEVSEPLDFSAPAGEARVSSADDFRIFLASSPKYTTQQLIDIYSAQSGVIAAVPNCEVTVDSLTDDAYSGEQWALDNAGQFAGTPGKDIDVSSVWSTGTTGTEAVVAVVDTGVDYTHEDLADNMWVNPYPRDLGGTYGYDFSQNDSDPMDENGHGTHCAGIIAAQANNGVGISGVNQKAKIMAVRFLGSDGSGSNFAAMQCYNYIYRAMKLGVNIVAINNSWGGVGYSSIFKAIFDRLGEMGAISVIAAGNASFDLNVLPILGAPATVDSSYVITVAAATHNAEMATFSNYGDDFVDIAAPGTGILSSVSYDNLLPMLLDDEKRAELTAGYADLEGYDSFGDMRVLAPEGAAFSAETSTEQFFGSKGASLRIDYSGLDANEPMYILFPYEAEAGEGISQVSLNLYKNSFSSQSEATLFDSAYFETREEFDERAARRIADASLSAANYWSTLSNIAQVANGEGPRCLVLRISSPDGNSSGSFYIDNPTASIITQDTSAFGKYAFYNGTSMAAPAVTGAVALVAAAYPQMDAPELRAAIIGSTVQTESLTGNVSTDGYLDLSKLGDPGPCMSDIALISDGTVEIYGYNFGSAPTVTINGEQKAIISASDNTISLSGEGLEEYQCEVEVKNDRGRCKMSKLITLGERGYEPVGSISDVYDGGELVSSGEALYYLDQHGLVYMLENDSFKKLGELDPRTLAPQANDGAAYKMFGKPAYLGGSIYAIFGIDEGYCATFRLARFSIAAGEWYDTAALPTEGGMDNAAYSTLAAYNGRLYIIGGIDLVSLQALSTVMRFEGSTRSWTRMADMPEGRFNSCANQIGNSLYISLGGGDKTTSMTSMLIFDGSAWKKGVESPAWTNTLLTFERDGEDVSIAFCRAAVGITDGGLIFSGATLDGMSDTVIYDVLTDSYRSASARLTQIDGFRTIGASTDGTFYCLMTAIQMDGAPDHAQLYALPIDSGMNKLSASVAGSGSFFGEGVYPPGDAVRIKAAPAPGWRLSGFRVNGAEKTSPTTVVMNSDVAVETVFSKTTVKITPPAGYIEAGRTRRLAASATDGAKLIWRSTNTALATVDDSGTVTAKPGAGGRYVSIYAFATDGSGAKARCVLYIFNKTTSLVLRAPGETLRAGKTMQLVAVRTPAAGTIERLVYSSSNTGVAAVSASGVVTARAAGSAVITAKTVDGSGVSARIAIKVVK